MVGLAFRALHRVYDVENALRVYDVENALLVYPISLVLFAAVAEPSLAKEILALMKPHAYVNLQSRFDHYFFRKYNVGHFVFDLRYSEVLVHFRPVFCPYFDFVETFEILRLPIGPQHLINAKPGKLYVLSGHKAYCVVSLLVGNVTQKPLRRVHVLESVEDLGGIHTALETQ